MPVTGSSGRAFYMRLESSQARLLKLHQAFEKLVYQPLLFALWELWSSSHSAVCAGASRSCGIPDYLDCQEVCVAVEGQASCPPSAPLSLLKY